MVLVAGIWWREREPPSLGELAEIAADDDRDGDAAPRAPAVSLGLALAGVALMVGGGDLAVRGAVRIVESIGRQDSAVGLTILALATTAELFALVLSATRHAVPEIAVAGVVGSAAYNATLSLGAGALVTPLPADDFRWPAVLAAVLPLVVIASARGTRLGRVGGALLLAGYAAYALVLLG